MEGLILLLAITAFCVIISYIAFNLDKDQHFFLQMILLVIVIVVASTQLPRVANEYNQDCKHIILNETIIGNTTHYTYNYTCNTSSDTNTPTTFYKTGFWTVRVFWAYLFLYLLWAVAKPMLEYLKERKGK